MSKKSSEQNLSVRLSERGKNSLSDWNGCKLNFWEKHSNCSKIPQSYKRNAAVFAGSMEHAKHLNDVKIDLNGSFQTLPESKWKRVELELGKIVSVKVISN